jgi:hypothetical protein
MSQSRSGEKNYWYGKHLPNETKRKLSEAIKGMFLVIKIIFTGNVFVELTIVNLVQYIALN